MSTLPELAREVEAWIECVDDEPGRDLGTFRLKPGAPEWVLRFIADIGSGVGSGSWKLRFIDDVLDIVAAQYPETTVYDLTGRCDLEPSTYTYQLWDWFNSESLHWDFVDEVLQVALVCTPVERRLIAKRYELHDFSLEVLFKYAQERQINNIYERVLQQLQREMERRGLIDRFGSFVADYWEGDDDDEEDEGDDY